jgi:hypothetical protein
MFRDVLLKPAFAHEYPNLAPNRWYTAAAVAGFVKGTRILTEGRDVQFAKRILNPAHFEFRGGGPRHGNWVGMRTRRLDRHPVPRLATAAV